MSNASGELDIQTLQAAMNWASTVARHPHCLRRIPHGTLCREKDGQRCNPYNTDDAEPFKIFARVPIVGYRRRFIWGGAYVKALPVDRPDRAARGKRQ